MKTQKDFSTDNDFFISSWSVFKIMILLSDKIQQIRIQDLILLNR